MFFRTNTTLSTSDSVDQTAGGGIVAKCPEVGTNQERPETGEINYRQ